MTETDERDAHAAQPAPPLSVKLPAQPQSVEEALAALRKLQAGLAAQGACNFYSASTLAYLHTGLKNELSNHMRASRGGAASQDREFLTIADGARIV